MEGEFSNHKFKLPVPYVIYADLESILGKISSCEQYPKISLTESIAKHVPCGFAYVIVGPDGTMIKPPTVFRGKNAIDQFLTKLFDEEKSIHNSLRFVKSMTFSMTDEENIKSPTLCSICEIHVNGDALRDHDHLTGAYRGAAHNSCNLNFKLANYIPVTYLKALELYARITTKLIHVIHIPFLVWYGKRILETKLMKPFPPKIIWCYGIYQKLFEKMSDIEFHEGIPSDVENITSALIIIDDLMNEVGGDKKTFKLVHERKPQ
ncbi:uncharacterized protein TNCV_4250811 [Trichonephila clavipes]|nr:uncharacterized protein TNCV_4250811 [Trichonephila clavipes]